MFMARLPLETQMPRRPCRGEVCGTAKRYMDRTSSPRPGREREDPPHQRRKDAEGHARPRRTPYLTPP